MTIDRWNLIEEIFQGALERPPSDRKEYVRGACGNDEELRSEVESLLASDHDAESVIHSLVDGDVEKLRQSSTACETDQQIGPYHLRRELDRGGMGVVYLAVRSDDQYFQVVAIKMIRKGLESPALVQRFRTERQVLATLTHPNIGAILDGGETRDGRPFMVMEYVEGLPITLASESRGLSIRQRIELFRSLCSAVHHAHQKLVIHRDIKPSNVLVTLEGVVKLIDFGISKPVAPELLPGELPPTESCQIMMTPDYASPEQLLGKPLTTTTDIYSMGVLLFELLTGSRPYTLRDLSPAAAERLVCEQESRKPSTVPGLLKRTRKELAGDLDRIVLMAMDQDPSRRYLSAQHFEEDLLRYLQGKPIAARRATAVYRLSKFVQRHRTAVLMACATVVVVICAIFFDSWQSRRAVHRVSQVEALANSTISDMTEKLEQSSTSVQTQAALFHTELEYLDKLRQSSGNDPHVLLELAKAYERVGDLEGSPFVADLGDAGSALHSYQEALRAATEAHSRLPGEASTRALIEAYQRLGRMEFFLGNLQDAANHYQQSLPLARDFWQQNSADLTRRRLLAMNYFGLGEVEFDNLETDKALENLRTALQTMNDDLSGNDDHDTWLARIHVRIGSTLNELGVQAESLVNFRTAIAIVEDLARRSPASKQARRSVFVVYNTIIGPLAGEQMLNVGDISQAQMYARKAVTMAEKLAAADSKNEQARRDLAFAYWGIGTAFRLTQPATASAWYRKSIARTRELIPTSESQHNLASREEALAAVLLKKDQAAERLALLQEANALRQKLLSTGRNLPERRLLLMRSYCRLSDAELALNDLAKAREYAGSALPFLNEFRLTSPSLLVLRDVGLCYESLGSVQRQIAMNRSSSFSERQTAQENTRQWYLKSAAVWEEWKRRGAATPESELEQHKIERLLQSTG